MESTTSRHACVTGASAGIGAAFAERLARDGYDLTLVARSAERLESMATTLRAAGRRVWVIPADLSKPEGVAAVVAALQASPPDLLVNNAGAGTKGAFYELDPARERELVDLNVVALLQLTRAALPGMVARGSGAVINLASVGAFTPTAFMATYTATKAFVVSFTEALAEELRGSGVYVQALCPGFTRTEFQQRAGLNSSSVADAMWSTPDQVVAASLQSMQRRQVICVPGLVNRVSVAAVALLPRSVVRRVSASFGRRF